MYVLLRAVVTAMKGLLARSCRKDFVSSGNNLKDELGRENKRHLKETTTTANENAESLRELKVTQAEF